MLFCYNNYSGDNMKYLKWVFGTNIGHKENEHFKIGKPITSDIWDPTNSDWDKRGGFNFTNEKCALRWMSRGDTLYEVEVPSDAEFVDVINQKTPGGIYIANKIILNNPVPISVELLEDFYKKSELPIETYFECVGLLASRGYDELALRIIKDKVTMDNIDLAINEFITSLKPWHEVNYETYNKVKEVLEEIKSPVDINLYIDKEPLVKKITEDKIINLSGQSGSGKSTYAKEHYSSDEYLIVDTDDIFSENRFSTSVGINKELGEYFRSKYPQLPNCGDDFDLIYNEILDYCKKYDKTIVIDSAQFHCIKDISLLKGTLIVLRTSINTCYERTIERYKANKKDYSYEELEAYKEKKKALFKWYKHTNVFLEVIMGIKK